MTIAQQQSQVRGIVACFTLNQCLNLTRYSPFAIRERGHSSPDDANFRSLGLIETVDGENTLTELGHAASDLASRRLMQSLRLASLAA